MADDKTLTRDQYKMALVTYRLTDDEQRSAFKVLSAHDAAQRARIAALEAENKRKDAVIEALGHRIFAVYEGMVAMKCSSCVASLESTNVPTDISQCSACFCITHTVEGKCGKCGAPKSTDEPTAGKEE